MELDAIVRRIREEFREMPGLRLTVAQATRLWGLEHETCRAVIERLVIGSIILHSCSETDMKRHFCRHPEAALCGDFRLIRRFCGRSLVRPT